ncbi:MAG: helix-turn-helix transcriptional regulator [Ruminococcaceae bacterium]|nr:helix-turn-helix transcriptional regulator [Oscillospiraceae bacterium]
MKLYIGENLKRLRTEKNITQDTLAGYLGVTYQAVSRWENSMAYPDIELLPELARFFEVSLEELMGTDSEEKEIRETVSECYLLSETDKPAALAKLHALEQSHPNNWYIKSAICNVLIYPKPQSYDEVLPELRRYAQEGIEKCTMKDVDAFRGIISSLILTVPAEEVKNWLAYVSPPYDPHHQSIMRERYSLIGDKEKVQHYRSGAVIGYLNHLIMQYERDPHMSRTAEEEIIAGNCILSMMNAVIGEPYRKDGRVHNSIMLWHYAKYRLDIAEAYADTDRTERALKELQKAVDMMLMHADAVKDEYFTSDSPFIEPWPNRWIDKYQGVDLGIEAMTNESEWPGLHSIRNDESFGEELQRLYEKKVELQEYYASCEPDTDQ